MGTNPKPFAGLARVISNVGSPPVVGLLAVLVSIAAVPTPQQMRWGLIYIVIAIIFPVIYIFDLVRRGKVTDFHLNVPRRTPAALFGNNRCRHRRLAVDHAVRGAESIAGGCVYQCGTDVDVMPDHDTVEDQHPWHRNFRASRVDLCVHRQHSHPRGSLHSTGWMVTGLSQTPHAATGNRRDSARRIACLHDGQALWDLSLWSRMLGGNPNGPQMWPVRQHSQQALGLVNAPALPNKFAYLPRCLDVGPIMLTETGDQFLTDSKFTHERIFNTFKIQRAPRIEFPIRFSRQGRKLHRLLLTRGLEDAKINFADTCRFNCICRQYITCSQRMCVIGAVVVVEIVNVVKQNGKPRHSIGAVARK